jgi:hypothetical protein
MVIMTVVPIVVLMVNVFMVHGHVTALKTVMTVLMKLIVVLLTVVMAILHVLMDLVYIVHGHVMDILTVETAQMKLTVLLHHVKIKDLLLVMMVNVYPHLIFVMDQLIPVMQVGVLTVQMVQMKV